MLITATRRQTKARPKGTTLQEEEAPAGGVSALLFPGNRVNGEGQRLPRSPRTQKLTQRSNSHARGNVETF